MPENKQASWGHHEKRFGGEPRPRKLLALEGGGIRGVLTLQVLIRMEELLAEKSGQGKTFDSAISSTTSAARVPVRSSRLVLRLVSRRNGCLTSTKKWDRQCSTRHSCSSG